MFLVDTNVLAYLTIEGDRTPAAQRLYARDSDWRSEAFILIEYSNILATYIRARALTLEQSADLLTAAEALMPTLASIPHARALQTAAQFRISAYDARFISLAMHMRVKLVTEDVKLRTAVPAWTRSLDDALD
ncbi:MAG: type II toxin-antitoxin system VapC family toxin [Steroidobacteraceae bacterium]